MGFLEVKPEIFRTFLENSGTIFRPFFGIFVARPKPEPRAEKQVDGAKRGKRRDRCQARKTCDRCQARENIYVNMWSMPSAGKHVTDAKSRTTRNRCAKRGMPRAGKHVTDAKSGKTRNRCAKRGKTCNWCLERKSKQPWPRWCKERENVHSALRAGKSITGPGGPCNQACVSRKSRKVFSPKKPSAKIWTPHSTKLLF